MSKIKKIIKQSFWGNYLISCYHCVMCKVMPALISDEKAVKRYYKKRFGKELDLNNPETFSEKINWYKLNSNDPLMAQCADKVAVRDYVISKGYGDCLNEVYGVYDNVDDIDIDKLPEQFVIKAAHGSHMNYIVKDKNSFDFKHAKKMMKSWLHQDIYWSGREWVYKDIPKRIIIEKYLEDESGDLSDYKIFCFNGVPEFIQYESGRYNKEHVRNFYDLDWNLLPFGKEIPHNPNASVDKPSNLIDMLDMAKDISADFQFVRVDLYFANHKRYFGELTFFPAGGAADFQPMEYDLIIGQKWNCHQ